MSGLGGRHGTAASDAHPHVIFRPGMPPEEGRHPGRARTTRRENGLIIERDVPVRVRDGIELLVDVLRPEGSARVPAILTFSPYGKHGRKNFDMFEPPQGTAVGVVDPGMRPGMVSPYTVWEGPDPLIFSRAGFAVINADARGSWESQGTLTFNTTTEANDGYDVVEWVAQQPWCNERVGMAGVSYLAFSQWSVAATQPPHLCAINPWEGYSDPYRDSRMHGGIRETRFRSWWIESTGFSRTRVEDVMAMSARHPLIDDYWHERTPDLSRIEVPLYAVIDWGDHGIHTRGTIEGFRRASSRHKWLEVHGRLKWPYFYAEQSVQRQLDFFNTFLRDDRQAGFRRPKVSIEVRERHYEGEVRDENQWPLEGTVYTPLYLNGPAARLQTEAIAEPGRVAYDSTQPDARASFDLTFTEDTEITGYMALHMWIAAPEAVDADLFVAVDKIDHDGQRVGFPFQSMFHDGPVALGWLRASHRELDNERATAWQPWHPHDRELALSGSEPVEVQIEIWPSSTLFRAGETLRLMIQGREFFTYPSVPVVVEHQETRNQGPHVIHTGGGRNSHLLVPVIPPREMADGGRDPVGGKGVAGNE